MRPILRICGTRYARMRSLTSETWAIIGPEEPSDHELTAALTAHLRGIGAPPGFSNTFLEDELLRVLTPIDRAGTIYQPDDFQELAAILGQY